MNNSSSIRVVKVGGSLFDLPDLPARLRSWLADEPPGHQVLITGGGPFCELVRACHRLNPLDEETAHWMCVDQMSVTARLLHSWLPEISLTADDGQLCQRLGEPGSTIFDVARWLRDSEPGLPGIKLDRSWDVTSDSIAGRLAITLQAEELVVLKSSVSTSEEDGLAILAAAGYVDRMLPRLASELPAVRFVNLRG